MEGRVYRLGKGPADGARGAAPGPGGPGRKLPQVERATTGARSGTANVAQTRSSAGKERYRQGAVQTTWGPPEQSKDNLLRFVR
jgi:hypothetical protein